MNLAEFLQNAQDFLPILLQGAWVTIQITVLSFLLSSAIGLVLALLKLSPIRALSWTASTIINVIRGCRLSCSCSTSTSCCRTWAFTSRRFMPG